MRDRLNFDSAPLLVQTHLEEDDNIQSRHLAGTLLRRKSTALLHIETLNNMISIQSQKRLQVGCYNPFSVFNGLRNDDISK